MEHNIVPVVIGVLMFLLQRLPSLKRNEASLAKWLQVLQFNII